LIHHEDLAALAPLWLQKTEEIRSDPRGRELAGWIADMWGYAFAAAEMGLRHGLQELAQGQMENRVDHPLVHYSYSSSDARGRWMWDKRTYRPWEPVPDRPIETPLATVALFDILNEWARVNEHRRLE